MKFLRVVIPIGVIIFIMGIIFHLQGQSLVGPESSFMYANPQWNSYGTQIAITGIVISGVGILIKLKNSSKTNNNKLDDSDS
jgi:hypothetical protein